MCFSYETTENASRYTFHVVFGPTNAILRGLLHVHILVWRLANTNGSDINTEMVIILFQLRYLTQILIHEDMYLLQDAWTLS